MSFQLTNRSDGYDFTGRKIEVGQTVVKVSTVGSSPRLELKYVSKVDETGIYLNDWHQPIVYSGRLIIVDKSIGE